MRHHLKETELHRVEGQDGLAGGGGEGEGGREGIRYSCEKPLRMSR